MFFKNIEKKNKKKKLRSKYYDYYFLKDLLLLSHKANKLNSL